MGCERYVKSLDGYTHLVIMLFGVLKHFDSLRELGNAWGNVASVAKYL
jgi:hypothetical protein